MVKLLVNLMARKQPFMLLSKTAFQEQASLWRTHLPMVKPYYAMKCNSDPVLCSWVRQAGFGFDCASYNEIDSARVMGTPVDDILYANPVKSRTELMGVKHVLNMEPAVTIDGLQELLKLESMGYAGKRILRISVDDKDSTVKFSNKFGANDCDLLAIWSRYAGRFDGVSFHVGSQSRDPNSFKDAIDRVLATVDRFSGMFKEAPLLDIGGGFPGNDHDLFVLQAQVIRKELAAQDRFKNVVAEPGRFLATRCGTLYVPIIGKRVIGGTMCYTLDESVYGCFNNVMFDHFDVGKNIVIPSDSSFQPCKLFGRTCDGIDIISDSIMLPPDLSIGQYLVFKNMGAYTTVAASTFNGFEKTAVYADT